MLQVTITITTMQTFQGALLYERDFATSVFSIDPLEPLDITESPPLHSKDDII
jgi:hypothetical protein